MWAAKLILAVSVAVVALVLIRIVWLRKHPEREIANVENRLLKDLQAGHEEKMLAGWNLLCHKIKKSMTGADLQLAQRGAEAIKLFVGEYFRGDIQNVALTAAVYRSLANLYAASIVQYPELAAEIIVALRVAAREIVGKNEETFNDVVRQFTLYGLLALREKRFYFTAKILDQLFLLLPKCINKGLAAQQQSVLRAIGILGQGAIKREDHGLTREISARLGQFQETAGRSVHEPIYDMLLKCVRSGSQETLEILLERSRSILCLETETEARHTLHIWGEAARNAAMLRDESGLRKVLACMMQVAENNLSGKNNISAACIDEYFSVLTYVFRDRTQDEFGELLIPGLELGCLCMRRELRFGLTEGVVTSYQGALKQLLDKLLHLGAVVTRDGQTCTGVWVARLYRQWTQNPDNAYRGEVILKFIQLWLLYWSNCQFRTAKRQGGLPEELFAKPGWSQPELARFPNLHIRSI